MTKTTSRPKAWSYASGILSRSCLQLAVFFVLGCLVEGRPRTLKGCGRRDMTIGRIVGGNYVQPGEYPWMVSVHEKNHFRRFTHICGGAILNEHYIVTAAHCIINPTKPSRYEIYVGLNLLSRKHKKPAQKYKIKEVIVHEDYGLYSEGHVKHDIALLRTNRPIEYEKSSGYINGICLPKNNVDPSGWAIVTGWGVVGEDAGTRSDILKAVQVPLVERRLCLQAYEEAVVEDSDEATNEDKDEDTDEDVDADADKDEDEDPDKDGDDGSSKESVLHEDVICAGVVKRDSCWGDSGGPLIQKNKRGIYTLIGIVSYGEGCARQRYPGVYTKVSSHMDWLEENMH